jgi:DNA polymerase III alpha subunit (gram-positive type)
MTYTVIEKHSNQYYLYEYRSQRINGKPRKIYVGYHGAIHLTTVQSVHLALQDPASDVSKLHRAYDTDQVIHVFDTETTGFSSRDQIWEYSALKIRIQKNDIEVMDEFYSRAYPDVEINPYAAEVTGMQRDYLRGYPPTREVYKIFRQWLGKDPMIAGQNIEFDIRMMNGSGRIRGYPMLTKQRSIDVLDIQKALHPDAKGFTLKDSMTREHISMTGDYHNAKADTMGTAQLLGKSAVKIDVIDRIKEKPMV